VLSLAGNLPMNMGGMVVRIIQRNACANFVHGKMRWI
jgi:hypothetical protein